MDIIGYNQVYCGIKNIFNIFNFEIEYQIVVCVDLSQKNVFVNYQYKIIRVVEMILSENKEGEEEMFESLVFILELCISRRG